MFASAYLQDNLLTLPSLPSTHQLAEIRQGKEEEARERLREIERVRELRRQEELARGPANTVVLSTARATEDTYDEEERGFAGASAGDVVGGEKKKRFEKLKNLSNKVIPKVTFKKEEEGEGERRRERRVGSSGWMSMSKTFGSIDSQDDPFSLQREQLMGYIEQARAAGRRDEVEALEQSLCEIETLMTERTQPPSYGYPHV